MKRKLLSSLIALCLALSLLPAISPRAEAASWIDGGAYDTSWLTGEEPYMISTPAQLAGLSALVDGGESFEDKEFVLAADINLAGRDWVPIGTGLNAHKRFRGRFDGGGFTVSGMRISGSFVSAGLFGYLDGGYIKNITIDASCAINSSGNNVGSVVGASYGSVENCVNYANVSSSYDGASGNVGGIAGFSGAGGAVLNCINEGRVAVSGKSRKNTGGLIGYNKGQVERSVNLGEVSSACSGSINNAGGLTGFENDGTTQNCYNRADVTASGGSENNAGGIAGRFSTSYGKLQNCYSTGKIKASGNETRTGGVIGRKLVGTVFYCYYKKSGDLTGIGGESDRRGFTTGMSGAQMTAVPGDIYGVWSEVSADGYNLGGVSLVDAMNRGIVEVPETWSRDETENDRYPIIATNNWTDKGSGQYYFADFSWVTGDGSEEHPYVISDGADLAGLSALVNARAGERLSGVDPAGEGSRSYAEAQSFEGKYIVLSDDIVLDKRLWTPIGSESRPFKGSFDGNGYSVFSMNIGTERVNADFVYNGLFGCSEGCIKNLSVGDGSTIFASGENASKIYAGAVAGLNKGEIIGCQSYCSIQVFQGGELYLGGITGKSWGRGAKLERCYNEADISADLSANGLDSLCGVGGIVGITGRETRQEKYDTEEDAKLRNGVFSCTNAGNTEVIVRGSDTKLLLGGVAGGNVLIKNQRTGTINLPGGADGGFSDIADPDAELEYSAAIINCSSTGSTSVTLRADGAKCALGGIAGGNVLALSEAGLESFFENEGVSLLEGAPLGIGSDMWSGVRRYELKSEAEIKNCFSAGKTSATLTNGETLRVGGVIGLCSEDDMEIENCFYEQGSVKSEYNGIGGGAEKLLENAASKSRTELVALTEQLTAWAAENEPELCSWWSDGAAYPFLSYKIYYNAAGGQGAPADNRIYAKGESARVDFSVTPKRENYIFKGWALDPQAEQAKFEKPAKNATKENVIKELKDSVVLYAIWESNQPKSKDTFTDTKKNDDGTTSSASTTKTVAKNGDVTTETTENITDSAGKPVSTKTITTFYDNQEKTTTEHIKEKLADGTVIKTAGFTMEDADKVAALPEELSKELRAGKLSELTLKDAKNETTASLGWESDESGKKLGQSARISSDKTDGAIKLTKALLGEVIKGGYSKLEVLPAKGIVISFSAASLSKLGEGGAEPELKGSLSGSKISISLSKGELPEALAIADYEQVSEGSIVAAEALNENGAKARVLGKYSDGKLTFKAAGSAAEYEIIEIDFPFADVSDNDWFAEAVKQMFAGGMMTGVTESEFAPQLTASRAMLVTLLWRMAGEPEGTGGGFADVASDAWYGKAVAWAAGSGIVNGVSARSFAPDQPITREQLITILFRMDNYGGDIDELPELGRFSDGGSVAAFAESAMRWAADKGYISGRPDGSLDPTGKTTRCELAAIMVRYLGM